MYNYRPSDNCLQIGKHYEECETLLPSGQIQSYWDEIGKVWTIGWGSTYYLNGTPVKEGDVISQAEADSLFQQVMNNTGMAVNQMLGNAPGILQQHFDALTEIAYNVGTDAIRQSTLLKKIIFNPNDSAIVEEFHKWDHGGGVVNYGLLARRHSDAYLYLYGVIKFFTEIEVEQ